MAGLLETLNEIANPKKRAEVIHGKLEHLNDKTALGQAFNVTLPDDATVYAVIWTTTPWTLPANQAVSVHPEQTYDLLQTTRGYLILAHELVASSSERFDLPVTFVASCQGTALENVSLKHPFQDRIVPLINGKHVTLEAGTGLVHTAPAHGVDDYVIGQRYKLPGDNPVGDDGKFISSTPPVGNTPLAGVFVWKANDIVLHALQTSGHLLHQEKLTHSYPHCWRHKTPIIFRSTPQWFIGLEHGETTPLRTLANAAVDQTQFFPSWGRARPRCRAPASRAWCCTTRAARATPCAPTRSRACGCPSWRRRRRCAAGCGPRSRAGTSSAWPTAPRRRAGAPATRSRRSTTPPRRSR